MKLSHAKMAAGWVLVENVGKEGGVEKKVGGGWMRIGWLMGRVWRGGFLAVRCTSDGQWRERRDGGGGACGRAGWAARKGKRTGRGGFGPNTIGD